MKAAEANNQLYHSLPVLHDTFARASTLNPEQRDTVGASLTNLVIPVNFLRAKAPLRSVFLKFS
jgi:hypothetical protein